MNTELILWRETIQAAEANCHVTLPPELEHYLISLMLRYTSQSDLAKQVIATQFLEALNERQSNRRIALATVGDHCLVLTGIFPGFTMSRAKNTRYFVELGRSAYAHIAAATNDIYLLLAQQFVLLMDVLQAINQRHTLLPLEAYDLWHELGSQRAHAILKSYRTIK